MNVIAIIGDVVSSRLIPSRDRFQRTLMETIADINTSHRPASPFTLSTGDEIEAAYRNADTLFRDLLTLTAAIYPQRIRFAIALGEITTDLNPDNPLVMDGPAFHTARKGIAELRSAKELLRIDTTLPIDIALEDHAARLLSYHVRQWKTTRWALYRLITAGTTPAAARKALGISLTAVYKNIKMGMIDLVQEMADDLGRSLSSKLGT
jgi:hypothetical protein